MNRFMVGLRALFRVWSDASFARRVGGLLEGSAEPAEAAGPPAPARSEALTLLAVLQREGRLIDFLQEPIEGFADAQIGAAVRDVHKGCAGAIDRMFALRPLTDSAEGSAFEVPADADPLRYRLVGNVAGEPPFRGTLRHHGWAAGRCEVPTWSGSDDTSAVVAAVEVELA
jgi:hypothetical protein